MFNTLAQLAVIAAETPMEQDKLWQTKTACGKQDGIHEAFISGVFDGALKTASDNELYILGSELGMELGVNMLVNLKEALNTK